MREWKNGENVEKVNFFYTISELQTTFLLLSLMKTDKTGQERRMVITGNHRRILNRVSSTELDAGGGNGKKLQATTERGNTLLLLSLPSQRCLCPFSPLGTSTEKQTITILIPCDIKRCWPFD